jgi:predicted O-linked N-acetylglucosamine transferase (SPINDLY family)
MSPHRTDGATSPGAESPGEVDGAARHRAALALAKAGELARAKALWRELLAREPDDPIVRYQIAIACHDAREFAEATYWYGEQLARYPRSRQAWYNLGLVRLEIGEARSAAEALEQATRIDPSHAHAWVALGTARRRLGDGGGALEAWTRASACDPKLVEPRQFAASALSEASELPAAIITLERAIAIEPRNASLRLMHATNLSHLGLHEAALSEFRQAIAIDPGDDRAHSALLLELSYDTRLASREEVAQAHKRWADAHCSGIARLSPTARSRSAHERLRVGYLSPRFGSGPLASFFLPVLRAHDRRRFHVTLYSAHPHADAASARMRAACDVWRELPADDDAAAALIASDEPDLLIDLAGHAPGHRLLVLARKPAPVQATWLDYPATTGLAAIDYLLSDAVHSPVDEAGLFSEQLVLLPRCRVVYAPLVAPKQTPPPSSSRGFVTFGSFNRHAKITDAMLMLWKSVLDAVPASRLTLRASAYGGRGTVEWLRARWTRAGIPVERIDFRPYVPLEEAIAAYADIDVALDTSPYNGGVTTCDALSMGVPVVALSGERMIARQSAALLGAVGHPEWIASTADEYVATAVRLARSPALSQLRDDLWRTFPDTPLCRVTEFVAALERAYERLIELGPRRDDGSGTMAPIVFAD